MRSHYPHARRYLRRGARLLVIVLALAHILTASAASYPTLVKNFHPDPARAPGTPTTGDFARLGNRTFFTADDGNSGSELWRTDGTPAGTTLVLDIVRGNEGSNPNDTVTLNGMLFFIVRIDGDYVVWRSDGTAAGTVLARDLLPAPHSQEVRSLIVFDGALLIITGDSDTGWRLWRSTGVPGGTTLLAKLPSYTSPLFVVGKQVFFIVSTELWVSDGTASGTHYVATIGYFDDTSHWTAWQGKLLFIKNGNLWQSDGTTAGTTTLLTGPFRHVVSLGRMLYLVSANPNRPQYDVLQYSDGTVTGTISLKNIRPSGSHVLVPAGGRLFFLDHATSGKSPALWTTAGTVATTKEVRAFSAPYDLAALGSSVVLLNPQGANGIGVWQSDGTAANTHLIKVLPSGTTRVSTALVDRVYFQTSTQLWESDGTSAGTLHLTTFPWPDGGLEDAFVPIVSNQKLFIATPHELWSSDGSTSGTQLLHTFGRPYNHFRKYVAFNNQVFFDDNRSLWRSDGTVAGTRMLLNADPLGESYIKYLIPADNTLYFITDQDEERLWRTDGTVTGTVQLRKLSDDFFWGVGPFTLFNGMLIFAARDGTRHAGELWRSDGTAAGTVQIMTFADMLGDSSYRFLGTVQQAVLLLVWKDNNHFELWKTNGTATGTHKITTIMGTAASVGVTVDNVLYFPVRVGEHVQLWRSDGTTVGTAHVATMYSPQSLGIDTGPETLTRVVGDQLYVVFWMGPRSYLWKRSRANTLALVTQLPRIDNYEISELNGKLALLAAAPESGSEIWVSDGTATGTHILKDIYPGAAHARPTLPQRIGGKWLFVAEDASGRAIWESDGTTSGTRAIRAPGQLPSGYAWGGLQPVSSAQAVFTGYTPETGVELWTTNGTASGTRMVHDLAPGPSSSAPRRSNVVGDQLLFIATDRHTGEELWGLDLGLGQQAYLPLIRR